MSGRADEEPREIYASEFYVLSSDYARGAALLQRSATPFVSLAVLRAENARVIAALPRCFLSGVVVDMRQAPANNNDDFETAMQGLRTAVGKSFVRVVVLVSSAVGELQMNRLHSRESAGYFVTRTLAEAWKLAGPPT